jgi:hypothetical protein
MHVNTLIILTPWVLVAWRLTKVNLRSDASRYGFITILSIALVITTQDGSIGLAIDHLANLPDLGRVVEYTCMTITCFSWGVTCLRVLREERTRKQMPIKANQWILALAPITLGAILVTWLIEVRSGQHIQDYVRRTDYNLVITLLAQSYLFCTVTGIGMVTAAYQVQNENNLALRLRLTALLAAHISLAMLPGSILIIHGLMLLKVLPSAFDTPLFTALLAISTLLMCSNLMPARFYVQLAICVDYLSKLLQIWRLKGLDTYTAQLISAPPYPLTLRQAILSPRYELLQLNMAILDREKHLVSSRSPAAQNVAKMMRNVSVKAQPNEDRDAQFSNLVKGLEAIARQIGHSRGESTP